MPGPRRGAASAAAPQVTLPDAGADTRSAADEAEKLSVRRLQRWTIIFLGLTMLATFASPVVVWMVSRPAPVTTLSFTSPGTLKQRGCSTTVPRTGLTLGGKAREEGLENVWLLVQAPGAGLYYLPSARPLSIAENGDWSTSIPFIGSDEDSGEAFNIVAVAGDLNVANYFTQLYNDPSRAPDAGASMKTPPAGASIVAAACVRRS